MLKKLCTFALVICLALPSTSAPAHASDDLKKILAALATMAVIGMAANELKSDPVVVPQPTPQPKPKPKPQKPPYGNAYGHYKKLPNQCLHTFNTSEGRATYFKQKCMKDNYKYAKRLPQQCLRTVWTEDGKRSLFSPACLNNWGFR
ncbi:hypothetical protein ACFE33_01185 [Falsihalocynthiibacter sp. SS001]|uniref:hypothetical protein n=1 Tax=Falsihalocynthiibacter sp. SS001 TaxID=3349698 RepID=UPI0036D3753E